MVTEIAVLDVRPGDVRQMEFAGSYRRGKETVGDLDLLADSDDAESIMDCLEELEDTDTIIARGDTKMSVRLAGGSSLMRWIC